MNFAGSGLEQPWRMTQARKSKRYTTNWSELPVVRLEGRKG
ncbi:MAG: DUF4113 domain-containing protein [Desulfovibrionales bacterium]